MADDDVLLPRKGDLVRWIRDYMFFSADNRGNAWPHNPVYEYGLIMEVSHTDPNALIVFGFKSKQMFIMDRLQDEIETISRAKRKLIVPTADEVKKYEK